MSKKKNCRRTPAEQVLHREAVRLRNMTDRQLVEQFHRAAEPETAPSARLRTQDGPEAAGGTGDSSPLQALLDGLAAGECKGVKSATVYKITAYATEKGLLA